MVKGIMGSIELYNTFLKELKNVNRRLITNIYYGQSELKELFETRHVQYDYEEAAYLLLYVNEHDFTRMLFAIVDANIDIEIAKIDWTMVYDIFENDKKTNRDHDAIKFEGFYEYRKYHRWICKEVVAENLEELDPKYVVCEELTQEALDLVSRIFDKYSDYIPDEQNAKKYLEAHKGILIYERTLKKLVAGLIYKEDGNVITAEFLFVDESISGNGIGSWIENYWFSIYKKCNNVKGIVWIDDTNRASQRLHLKLGYVMDIMSKTTYKSCD